MTKESSKIQLTGSYENKVGLKNRSQVDVSQFTEGLIYIGLTLTGISCLIFEIVSLSGKSWAPYDIWLSILYFLGALSVFVGGISALIQVSQCYQYMWFVFLFVGSQMSLWSPMFATIRVPTHIFYLLVIFGGVLNCVSIAMIQMFRHISYRRIAKGCIIVGIILCHTGSIVNIYGEFWILFDIGIVLIAAGYIPARYMSIRRMMDMHLSAPADEENPILTNSN